MKMKALLLRASFGWDKRKRPWLRLSYTCGAYKKSPLGAYGSAWFGNCGLKLAHSFVPFKYQEDVRDFLGELEEGQFPFLVYLELSTNDGKNVEVVGISPADDPDFSNP